MAYYEAYFNKQLIPPPPTTDPRELSPLIGANYTAYGSNPKPEARPKHKKKKAASCLSEAFISLRGAILNGVAPAHDGTAFTQNERQKRAINDFVNSNPDPWHEYGRLDSDTEDDDRYNDGDSPHHPYSKKRPFMSKFKAWADRIATKYEDALAPQGAAYICGG
ncbi:hypothetical protein HD806DRAFT_295344 [Xylariaceae sp. AK1471]|nr:hypothetical protein HD806DRAFT_295344 [Xylariaceae sp. AK1471]